MKVNIEKLKGTRKFLLICMSLLVISALIVGCGGGQQATQPQESPQENQGEKVEQKGIDYPTNTIRHIVWASPGSGSDIYTRALVPYLQENIGGPIVVENVVGAGGRVATAQVFRANPDGYTIMTHMLPAIVQGEYAFNGDYETLEMTPIANFFEERYLVAVGKDSPYDTFDELVEAMETKRLKNAPMGIGSGSHLESLILKDELGISYEEVPYDGYGEAMAALMGNHIDFLIVPGMVAAGNTDRLKLLAWMGPERDSRFPDVPTLVEMGYPDAGLGFTGSIWGPPGMPEEVAEKLEKAVLDALENEELVDQLTRAGVIVRPKTADELMADVKVNIEAVERLKHLFN